MQNIAQFTANALRRASSRPATMGFLNARQATYLTLGLTLVGWTLIWAEALGLVDVMPVWLAAIIFYAGLGFIPFGARRERACDAWPIGDCAREQ